MYEFAKNKLEPFIKQQRQAMNPEEVRHFKEERARVFEEWDGALNNTRKGSNLIVTARADSRMEVLLRARLLMKGFLQRLFRIDLLLLRIVFKCL